MHSKTGNQTPKGTKQINKSHELNITYSKGTDKQKVLITDSTGPLPGRGRYYQKPPSPYPCTNPTTKPETPLSKHYTGWQRCSYQGHYFKKSKRKRALKYCNDICQEIERWRQRHTTTTGAPDPDPLTPEQLRRAKINYNMKMAFGPQVKIPGQKPKHRMEYIDPQEVEDFKLFLEKELHREHLEALELKEWIKPITKVFQEETPPEGPPPASPEPVPA
ncbi:MAG TPA: hypothetical protein PKK85_10025 [Methanobacteriaceae archaeon]|nr:hypothetical protein [Methanobacteriaceae archaeon]